MSRPTTPELGAVDLRGDAPAVPSTDRPPDAGGRERDVVTSAQERERRASGERVSAHGASDARAADVAVSEALAERERRAEEAPDDADVSKGPEGAAADDVWMPAFDAFGQPVAASAGEREPASRTPARADEESGTDGEPGAVTAEIERLLGARVAGDGRLGDPNEPGSWRFSIVGDDDGRSADAFVVTRLESGTMTVTIEAERAHADAALDELTRRLAAVDERIVVEVHGRLDPPA